MSKNKDVLLMLGVWFLCGLLGIVGLAKTPPKRPTNGMIIAGGMVFGPLTLAMYAVRLLSDTCLINCDVEKENKIESITIGADVTQCSVVNNGVTFCERPIPDSYLQTIYSTSCGKSIIMLSEVDVKHSTTCDIGLTSFEECVRYEYSDCK